MKRIIITASIILGCTLQSSAQITKSSYVVGGSSSFSFNTDNNFVGELNTISFSIKPDIGKFVSEKWLIGGGVGYSISKTRQSNFYITSEGLVQSFSGNFAATRFYSIADKFYFTCEFSLGATYSIRSSKLYTDTGPMESSSSIISPNIGVSPGLTYFVNEKWMIYARVGALSYNYAHRIESKTGSHSLGYSLQANSFGIGVRYILGSKK